MPLKNFRDCERSVGHGITVTTQPDLPLNGPILFKLLALLALSEYIYSPIIVLLPFQRKNVGQFN